MPSPTAFSLRQLARRRQQRHAGVPEAERREPLELLTEIERQLVTADDRVNLNHRPQVVLVECCSGMIGERVGERAQAVRPDREPGGGPVTTEALELARACGQRAVEIEGGYRPAGALPLILGGCDQHDRPVEPLDEPGRDDADHTLMPVLAPDDVSPAPALRLRPRLDLAHGVAEDLPLDGLALAVERFQLPGEPVGFLGVVRQEQLESRPRVAQAPRGIDPRRKPETHGTGIDRGRVDRRAAHQRLKSRLAGARQATQAGRGEPTVLVDERNDVGDRCEPDEIEILDELSPPTSASASL